MDHDDPTAAWATAEFDTRFRRTLEAIRAEVKDTEEGTIRRVLDSGDALERASLVIALGHCKRIAVVLKSSPDDEGPRAWDQRARAFLEGLVGDGPLLGVETLRPSQAALDATPDEELTILNTNDPHGALRLVDDQGEILGWPSCPTT